MGLAGPAGEWWPGGGRWFDRQQRESGVLRAQRGSGVPGGFVCGSKAIKNPDGSSNYVPCEGTICTNPNHGGGDNAGVPGDADSSNPSGAGQDSPSGQ
ncbi:Hypothetical protein ERS075590_03881 [Mycobacteroides abscessus]|nr:Hypothetical protein ERS075590_03881 [Mycobacteroides abscessus]